MPPAYLTLTDFIVYTALLQALFTMTVFGTLGAYLHFRCSRLESKVKVISRLVELDDKGH